MSETDTCLAGHENPRKMCRCNSMSEEPCSYCDWWEYHGDCESEEGEDDE